MGGSGDRRRSGKVCIYIEDDDLFLPIFTTFPSPPAELEPPAGNEMGDLKLDRLSYSTPFSPFSRSLLFSFFFPSPFHLSSLLCDLKYKWHDTHRGHFPPSRFFFLSLFPQSLLDISGKITWANPSLHFLPPSFFPQSFFRSSLPVLADGRQKKPIAELPASFLLAGNFFFFFLSPTDSSVWLDRKGTIREIDARGDSLSRVFLPLFRALFPFPPSPFPRHQAQ